MRNDLGGWAQGVRKRIMDYSRYKRGEGGGFKVVAQPEQTSRDAVVPGLIRFSIWSSQRKAKKGKYNSLNMVGC